MENITKVFIGVDISKAYLDIYIHPIGRKMRIDNTKKGVSSFLREISQYCIGQVIFESSGGYESLLAKVLQKAEVKAWRVNPAKICAFRESEGIYAKSDTFDAKVLAFFGEQKQRHYEPHRYSKEEEKLKEFVNRRSELIKMMIAEKARLKGPTGKHCKKSIERVLKFFEKELERIEKEIEDLKPKMKELQPKTVLLESIPGVGGITAITLLATVPELGSITNKQASALIGVAPYTRRSGTYRGKEFIKGGRETPRRTLYMATLTAVRHNKVLKEFYERLIKAGKKAKIALVACMRKLTGIINAMLRKNELWKPSFRE